MPPLGFATFAAFGIAVIKVVVVSLVVGFISRLLLPRPKLGDFGIQARTVTVTAAVAPRRIVLGSARVGGVIVYMTTTNNGSDLHIVIALCDAPEGPVTAIDAVWVDGVPILPQDLDSAGNVAIGRFAGVMRIKKFLGAAPQTADPDLVAEVEEWTADHRLDGIAGLYLRLQRDQAAFPGGLPNISADVRGLAVPDPRDAGLRFSRNVALQQRWWLASAEWGLGAPDSEIDDPAAIAAANLAEETVAVAVTDDQGAPIEDDFATKFATDWFARLTTTAPFTQAAAQQVTLSTTGALPAPLIAGRIYYVIADQRKAEIFRLADSAEDARNIVAIDITSFGSGTHTLTVTITKNIKDEGPETTVFNDNFVSLGTPNRLRRSGDKIGWRRGDTVRLTTDGGLPPPLLTATDYFVMPDAGGGFRLAADYAAAIADTPITITGPGTGIHTVTRTAEARYAGGGLIAANITRRNSLEGLLTASGGRAVWLGGVWTLSGAAARTSALTLAEDDLRGNIKVTTKLPRRDRFNAVQGLYHAPDSNGQPASYPKLASAAFKAADGGEEILRNVDLPFTDSPATCQRLAKIELLRARQEIEFVSPFSLKALQLRATDWFSVDNTRFGWTAKIFDCSQWQLAVDGTPPALTIRMTGHEAAASDFDWASSEEQTTDPAPDTDLPSPWDIEAPAGLMLVETLYETRDGAGVKSRANLSWAAAADGNVSGYEIQYRSTKATTWIEARPVAVALVAIDDIAPDIYQFRVRALGRGGEVGPWSEFLEAEINGLLAPPANNTGLGIQQISAMAILTWDEHPDLDVRHGGMHRIRWSPAQTGAAWNTAVETADPVPGGATQVMTPLRQGSYLVRAYDSSGVPSPLAAVISTRAAEQLDFTTFATVTESPTFPGSHAGTVAIDGILKLAGAGLFDAIPDLDLLSDLDSFGGVGAAGTYTFAAGIDMGSVKTVRLSASVTATAVNVLDKIDDRTALIDTWEDFDGVPTGDADLQTYFRETDDDPGGSPTWSPYQKLTAADRNARGFEFQARLSTTDPAYNIHATALSAKAEEVV